MSTRKKNLSRGVYRHKSKSNKNNKTKNTRKNSKIYNMRGCSKKNRKMNGGGRLADFSSAYSNQSIFSVKNPHMAYTGKGGSHPAYVSSGPEPKPLGWLNSQQKGGCGCGLKGGGDHRPDCKCSECKTMHQQMGGSSLPYPSGLVGKAWDSNMNNWPGVNGMSGDSNHLALNTYSPNDISRQMVSTRTPASNNHVGGKRRNKRGGFIDLGGMLRNGISNTYNTLNGYDKLPSVLPWKDQFPNMTNYNTLKFYK